MLGVKRTLRKLLLILVNTAFFIMRKSYYEKRHIENAIVFAEDDMLDNERENGGILLSKQNVILVLIANEGTHIM